MKEVKLRDAKSLPSIVEAAEHREPTRVTSEVPSFADLLLMVPPLDPSDLPKRRPARIIRVG